MKVINEQKFSGQVNWDELFDSEQELIDKMMECEPENGVAPLGYGFLNVFKRWYKRFGQITPAQMTVLKQYAASIYAYVNGHEIESLLVRI